MNIVGGAARPEENGKAVVFVNLHYYPDVAAAGQHLQDLAEYLASRGCRVEVFSGRTSYQGDSLDAPSTERRGGVQVTRLRTPIFGRRDVAGRLFGYAIFLVRTSVRLFFRRRERVIFLTTPPLLPVAGYLLRLLRLGPRYAIWSMDLHPEAEIAVGILSSSSVVTRLLRWLDARAFTEADFVVAVGQRMRERLQEKGVAPGQVYVVPGWADGEELVPVARECNPLVGFLGLETKFVVCYSGNAGLMHDFSVILDAVELLRDEARIEFLFIGDGPRREEIERRASDRGLGNLTYLDYFPRADLKNSLSVADVHLVCLRQDAVGISIPAKIYSIMAVARPAVFVGPSRSDTAAVIARTGCGLVIDPDIAHDPAATLAETLLHLRDDPGGRERLGRLGRKALVERFSRDRNCQRLAELLRCRWGAHPNLD